MEVDFKDESALCEIGREAAHIEYQDNVGTW